MNNNAMQRQKATNEKPRDKSTLLKKSKGQLTRDAILDAGENQFARFGYAGTTLDAVAEKVGISKQNLLHHYSSKAKLYTAVIDYIMLPLEKMDRLIEQLYQSFSDPLTPQDIADSSRPLEMWVDLITERPSIANLIMFGAVLPENSSAPNEIAKIGAQSFSLFERTFRKIAPNASPEEIHHIASTITGTVLFYSSTLNQLTGKHGKAKRAASQARHKELVLFTAKTLIQEINQPEKITNH